MVSARDGMDTDLTSVRTAIPARQRRLYAAAVATIVLCGGWVMWPVLSGGPITDDFIEAAMIDGRFAAPRHPLDLFVFTTGAKDDIAALQRLGSMPWWVSPQLRLSFLRPLASAMVHVDRALFGDDLSAYHAHSLLWWVALVIAAAGFYRVWFGLPIAALSLALFALNDAHHFAVLWLANRGGLVSLCFGIIGLRILCAHQLAPSAGRALAALALFCVSLLGGEWVFPLFAYALTHALFLGRASPTRRIARLWPMLLPAVGFLAARAALGYGARASGVYVDPIGEPLRFLIALATRAPLLVADVVLDIPAHYWDVGSPWRSRILSWGIFSPDVWVQLPSWRFWHVLLGYVALLATVAGVAWVIRCAPAPRKAQLKFLAYGAALSLVPVVASFPSSRLALPAWLGGAACAAQLLWQLGCDLRQAGNLRLWSFAWRYLVGLGLLNNLLWSPLHAPVQKMAEGGEAVVEWVMAAEVDDRRLPDQHVFIVNGTDFSSTFFFPYVLSYYGRPQPKSCYPLTFTRHPVDVERIDAHSLLIRVISGTFLETDAEVFFRSPSAPLARGERFALPGMTVEVTRVRHGRPWELLFRFERPLEDPSYLFLASQPLGLERLEPPPVGESIRLARPVPPNWYGAQRGGWQRRAGPLPEFIDYRAFPEFIDYQTPRQRYLERHRRKREDAKDPTE